MTRLFRLETWYYAPSEGENDHDRLLDLLSERLACAPEEIGLARTEYGKPVLAPRENGAQKLNFNLSHTRRLTFIAISRDLEIGVDVEYVRPRRNYLSIARYAFLPEEYRAISETPEPAQAARFVSIWARKEAIIKAVGGSAACLLDRFPVSTDPSRTEGSAEIPGRARGLPSSVVSDESIRIQYRDLPAGLFHRATVAWIDRGAAVEIAYRRLSMCRFS